MSFIKVKVIQIWSSLKHRIKVKIQHQSIRKKQHQVFIVKPLKPTHSCSSDNKVIVVETKHLKRYRTIWNFIDFLAYLVGCSVYREVEINSRFILSTALIIFSYGSVFYTILVVWPNIPTLLEVICLFGIMLPNTIKYHLLVKKPKYFSSMYRFFEDVLIKNTTGKRADYLEKEMQDALRKVTIFTVISLLCFGVFSLYPIYAYLNEGRLVPLMRLEFPFVDQTTTEGYLIGLVIMLTFGLAASFCFVAFDSMVLMLLLVNGSLVTQLELDLKEYQEMWKNQKTFSAKQREYFLRNICIKCQDINSYLRYFNHLFGGCTCYSVCILYVSLISLVYAVRDNGWKSGYGLAIFCFVQLYIFCLLGTYAKKQNDRMNQAIYCIPSWYEYPVQVQKTFLMLLQLSSVQTKQTELWVGPLAPLNVETGLKMTKSIYSYYTAMSNLT